MIDLRLNESQVQEIKYEIKGSKTVVFKLQNSELIDVEIIEESVRPETKKEFEDRKTREMIDASKNMFDSYRENAQNKKIKGLKEIGETILKKPLIYSNFVNDELTTTDKSKQLIEKDAKEDAKIIKERVTNAIGTNEPLSDELINAPEERSFNETAWENKDMSKPLGKIPEEIKKTW